MHAGVYLISRIDLCIYRLTSLIIQYCVQHLGVPFSVCVCLYACQCGSFRKLGVPYFGVLIIRILRFEVLY